MELQHQVAEIRSLAPIEALCPIYSVQRRPWYKVYKAQCMIPFPMYSIKVVYIITFIAFKIYVRIELYLVPMVYPSAFPIQYGNNNPINPVEGVSKPIPIAGYSFNCIYCSRCKLGASCKSHIQSDFFKQKIEKQKQQLEKKLNNNDTVIEGKMEEQQQ